MAAMTSSAPELQPGGAQAKNDVLVGDYRGEHDGGAGGMDDGWRVTDTAEHT